MYRLNKLAAAVGAAAMLGYGSSASANISAPGAIADAMLSLSGFTILAGNNDASKSNTALPINFKTKVVKIDGVDTTVIDNTVAPVAGTVTLTSITNFYQGTASINAGSVSQSISNFVPGLPVNLVQAIGPDAGSFVPGTTLNQPTDVTGTYSGAASTSTGNAIDPTTGGDNVVVHSQSQSNQSSTTGSSLSKQNLTTEFSIKIGSGDKFRFELNFLATGFLRVALGEDGVPNAANAAYTWSATVFNRKTQDKVFVWTPNRVVTTPGDRNLDGTCINDGSCTEYAAAFDMNDGRGITSLNDAQVTGFGNFDAELTLAEGDYSFFITHTTNTDFKTPNAIPEPTSLALLGLGMLGVGAANRRRKG